ncbi:autotransporter outer membrane beta-barrel domain-containing protein [Helicobacter sp. faydin-H20]|uniref:autotransporter outer membrane beta-barrel domain-containing protein n=1 Tax=Helicobacter anatolicus TaxID=2905874 RepID=UPI001E42B447|nr:autotransporter outer membrane beta-barrel domain-containing protein [Helicobacter anatolicus]MCE3036926.1 autotransporter outer membrane beta-barrel domain-containing protein [Helicobacter anatolicus]
MKKSLRLVFISLFFSPLFSATNKTVTQIQQTYNTDTTLNIQIDLDNTPNNNGQGFSYCNSDQSNCYTGAIFSTYNTLTLNNNANLTVNLTATGNYGGWAAVFFRGEGGKIYEIKGGSFRLNLLSLPNPNVALPVEGVFLTRRKHSDLPAIFKFNTDIYVDATENFYITRGIFNVNDGDGGYYFNQNTFIDVSKMQKSLGWHGSGVGYRSITSISGNGVFYINYNPDTKTTYNPNNIVQLKGDIAVELASTAKSEAIIHLTNPMSFFQGRFSLQGQANAELLLDKGGKWFLTANSAIRTLVANNNANDIKNQYGNIEKIAVVDFTAIADDGENSRLTSDADFTKRELKIQRELKGNYGVFRLMADVPKAMVDKVSTEKLSGNHYIQLYQKGSRLSFDVAGKNMIVAHANEVQGDFIGLETITGIYNYIPTLAKIPGQGGGTDWVLAQIDYVPNQTAKTLFNIFSIPYRIFKLEADSINNRINDLLFPPMNFGAWFKVYGGGIYQKNDFDKKETTQNLFYSLQGGFDYGANIQDMRYFFGGSFDFLELFGSDKGYTGSTKAYGFGFYGGFIKNDDLFIDGKIKYILGHSTNSLIQAKTPFDFYANIFLANLRIGYSFYPFRNARNKTIQKCKKGGDGKLFCRNDISVGYVRDSRFYIQPFISLTPGIISNARLDFLDKTTNYTVKSALDASPALITKIGVLGVKRYDYGNFSVKANTQITYSYDLNTGGKIMLIDDANIPLFNNDKKGQHHLGLGLGAEVLLFYDSLRFFADFKTEFFGKINTYWLLSTGLRYKFGQIIKKPKGRYSVRPKEVQRKRSTKQVFRPYDPNLEKNPQRRSFKNRNHFKEVNRGAIR